MQPLQSAISSWASRAATLLSIIRAGRFLLFAGGLFLGAYAAPAYSDLSPSVADTPSHAAAGRPRVGLALSGGGARGYAHIGVLKALETMRVPIDYIAGTSIGALVGGLYASGWSGAQLEAALSKIDLSAIALDRNERATLPQSLREDEFQYPIGPAVGYQDGVFRLPSGLVQGNRLLALLQDWTAGVPADIDFDHLVIPFRTVATDLSNGEAVILRAGSLPLAMRASAAVPGLFAPIELNGRTFVDGGLVDNLPVELVRTMGADIVIAVDIGSPLVDPATLRSPASVMSQMVSIFVRQNVQRQKAQLRKGDILIEPNLDNLDFDDFAAANRGIKDGWLATWQAAGPLNALALSPAAWDDYQAQRALRRRAPEPLRVDAIEVTTLGRIPPAKVRQAITLREGQIYDPLQLNRELAELSTTGDFQGVTQQLVKQDDKNVVKIVANEKSWGRHFFLFGFGISNSFNGQGSFNLQVGHRYPWINPSGLEWRNDIVLGSNKIQWHTEARQPLHAQGFYVAPYFQYDRKHTDFYQNGDAGKAALPVTSYKIEMAVGGVELGVPIGRLGTLRAGVGYQQLTSTPRYYGFDGRTTYTLPTDRAHQPIAHAELVIDQLDAPLFPRQGYYFYGNTTRGYGNSADQYGDMHAKILWALNKGPHTVNLALEAAGTYLGSNRYHGMGFNLGGFQRLSAYATEQFTGNFLLYGRVTYLFNSPHITFPGLNDLVLGSSLEIGEVWQLRTNFGKGPYKTSASLFIGGKSIVGPLYLGVAAAGLDIWNVYLRFGQVF